MADYTLTQRDLPLPLVATLTDDTGSPVDISEATFLTFVMVSLEDGTPVIPGGTAALVTDGTDGKIRYPWQIGDTNTPGLYEAQFVVAWADGTILHFPADPKILLEILPTIPPAFTYDPLQPVGEVRLWLMDTNPTRPVFTDAELTAFLLRSNNRPKLAAVFALEALANNAARLSKIVKLGQLQIDKDKPAKNLNERAKLLRDQCILIPRTSTEDVAAEFTLTDRRTGVTGSMEVW